MWNSFCALGLVLFLIHPDVSNAQAKDNALLKQLEKKIENLQTQSGEPNAIIVMNDNERYNRNDDHYVLKAEQLRTTVQLLQSQLNLAASGLVSAQNSIIAMEKKIGENKDDRKVLDEVKLIWRSNFKAVNMTLGSLTNRLVLSNPILSLG